MCVCTRFAENPSSSSCDSNQLSPPLSVQTQPDCSRTVFRAIHTIHVRACVRACVCLQNGVWVKPKEMINFLNWGHLLPEDSDLTAGQRVSAQREWNKLNTLLKQGLRMSSEDAVQVSRRLPRLSGVDVEVFSRERFSRSCHPHWTARTAHIDNIERLAGRHCHTQTYKRFEGWIDNAGMNAAFAQFEPAPLESSDARAGRRYDDLLLAFELDTVLWVHPSWLSILSRAKLNPSR
jgi:hypothetical protein